MAEKAAILTAPRLLGNRMDGDYTQNLQELIPNGVTVKKGDKVAEFDRQYMWLQLDDYEAVVAQGERYLKVLDGRLDVDYPTVVAIAPGIVRWGAGETWSIAIERALFGPAALPGTELELLTAADRLGDAGLALLTVDLGTARLAAAGIHRLSVQLANA